MLFLCIDCADAVKANAAQAESYKQDVTLGDYKNMEFFVEAEDYAVTDEDVENEIESYVDYSASSDVLRDVACTCSYVNYGASSGRLHEPMCT